MPAVIHTKEFGSVEFDKFFSQGNVTVGKLTGGRGYAYTSGLMVQKKKELDIIPSGPDREEAYSWYDHKDDVMEQPRRRVIIDPDTNRFMFDDGSPITSYEDIVTNIPPGPLQNAALDAFAIQRRQEAEQKEMVESSPVGKVAEEVAKLAPKAQPKAGPKKPPPKAKK